MINLVTSRSFCGVVIPRAVEFENCRVFFLIHVRVGRKIQNIMNYVEA